MKQVLQNLKTGITEVTDVPCPRAGRGQLLIRSSHTLVSAGTERMLVDFGKAGLIDKARQQPDKVRMVLDKGPHRRADSHSGSHAQQAGPAAAHGLLQRGRGGRGGRRGQWPRGD